MDLNKPEIFYKKIKVTSEDIDELKHVNNVIYLKWVQELANEHWLSRATPNLLKYKWVAINHYIEYKRPAYIGDVIIGKTYIGKTEGVRCVRFAEFYKDDQVIVQARSEWCMVEEATLRPVRVPAEMYKLFMRKK